MTLVPCNPSCKPPEAGLVTLLCVMPQAWDEFKPYKKENKRTKARDAARASVSMDGSDAGIADDG